MAKDTRLLIQGLRSAAERLSSGAAYEWGHMARCNCGHLVQSLTGMDDRQVSRAVEHHLDEWTEHAKLYCPQSGRAVDDVLAQLEKVGISRTDVMHLENLSDPRVLEHLGSNIHLRKNQREDVVIYLNAMADMLEGTLPEDPAPRKEVREIPIEFPVLLTRLGERHA